MAMSTTSSLGERRLHEDTPILPLISPLTDRRKLDALTFEPAAAALERGGFTVGWNEGALQVGGSPAHSGFSTPIGYRPRSSGFLSFNRTRESPGRPRTSGSFSAATSPHAPPSPSSPGGRGAPSRGRFSRLAASFDSAPHLNGLSSGALHPAPHPGSLSGPSDVQGYSGKAEPPQVMHLPPGPSQEPVPLLQSPPLREPRPAGGPPPGPAPPPLPTSQQVAAHMRVNIPLTNLKDCDRPGTGYGTGFSAGFARTNGGTIIQVPLGVPSPQSPQAQAAAFRATRGQSLLVFNELDSDKNGKITRSEMEAAALSLGFSLEQAQRLWDKLDRRKRGFLEALDWGSKDAFTQIQLFSTRYLQKYMGVPDVSATPETVRKYWRGLELKQVNSLAAAINKVRINAVAKSTKSAGSTGNAVWDTFRYFDVDNSGELNKDEIRDAFFALGVNLADEVVEQIMTVFDKDGNGTVMYHEFERTMFPGVSRGT
ncbi:hypothetical protein HYH03_001649 [Edaphochlamys debaryana]|uniref:EF-hand domain-containing protein n=1 Tax=Edaphochlamys debaryana TaxID=47281 RepID=A0A836C5G9_9CHLO|nr:hypothetical protein HYH03_001649 [Edaphochlamys debaryana]|eukprot:KAG2500890.1 hypothetical protein HYH03_001649 [Edaphochlamys debaryana]